MRSYFQVNSHRQKTSKNTAAMCCFLKFDSSLQKKWRKSINKPSKRKMQHLRCLLMIYKIVTIRSKPFNMKTWHCRHIEICIRLSYKDVKIPSPILKYVMFLMREIQTKTTLSSLCENIQHLATINIMTCHIMLRGYKSVKGMLN